VALLGACLVKQSGLRARGGRGKHDLHDRRLTGVERAERRENPGKAWLGEVGTQRRVRAAEREPPDPSHVLGIEVAYRSLSHAARGKSRAQRLGDGGEDLVAFDPHLEAHPVAIAGQFDRGAPRPPEPLGGDQQ